MSAPGSSYLPPLSPTYQSSQLWTPLQLRRLTIDQSHYHKYVSEALNTPPAHLNILHRRVQRYGDNHFHLHKDIPIHQDYSLTTLHLSNLRPWDQLVDRPLETGRVLQKEFHLPFPAEHPYTSHISQFAVFPDTHLAHHHMSTTPRGHTHRDCGIQTDLGPYYVSHKASEMGVRIEHHHMFPHVTTLRGHVTTDGRGQLWDIPRSKRHQRSQTYPAPQLQCTPSQQAPLTISPQTREALRKIHCLTSETTSYTDHFGVPPPSPGGPNNTTTRQNLTSGYSRPIYMARSHSRPYTAESRAKYRGKLVRGEEEVEVEEEVEEEEEEMVLMKDVATQTELDDDYLLTPTPTPLQLHHMPMDTTTLPQLTNRCQRATNQRSKSATTVPIPTSTVGTRLGPQGMDPRQGHQHSRSFDEHSHLRTSSARKFTQLNGFSRSDVQKQFHSQYPELAPDLRQYGMQKGKRHTIHGYNSYHFH